MAPTSRITPRELNILITGFGPFMSVGNNPSWLAVRPLHDGLLDLDVPPPSLSKGVVGGQEETVRRERRDDEIVRARIQTIQLPVHYRSVLDVVARIHGSEVSKEARFWHDSRLDAEFGGKQGEAFPQGYPIEPRTVGGWDVVIHVGVGRQGTLRCETQAHKYGYGKPDANSDLAPLVTPRPPNVLPKHLDKDGNVRGFNSHYQAFNELESTPVHVSQLIAWLKSNGVTDTEIDQSFDPGRYVCDFIFYCSLCEAKRAGNGTKVLFVHVPPEGKDLQVERCSEIIEGVAWWMARSRARELGMNV